MPVERGTSAQKADVVPFAAWGFRHTDAVTVHSMSRWAAVLSIAEAAWHRKEVRQLPRTAASPQVTGGGHVRPPMRHSSPMSRPGGQSWRLAGAATCFAGFHVVESRLLLSGRQVVI